ncbi:hypothetical protein BDV26DRAFT_256086 [Aspergillus bertholletiae]|uniref:gamma-glutamylcyclotransferase n=1 Tax=Aspergillus bertholletiae TaxID=1226010 RepID=A0A5N7BH75_9EURO|nr:hypothetical protein BDV26DRAFT_256086 [Aspergillus bertholletiae]
MGASYHGNQPKEDSPDVVPTGSSTHGMFERLWELVPGGYSKDSTSRATSCHLPETTSNRRRASVAEHSLERDEHLAEHLPKIPSRHNERSKPYPPRETVLYLAYGSNLASKTFLGMRGIKPLSQINVIVPELRLTFDLPGLPYLEPCFAASQFRDASCKGMDTDDITDNELEGDLTSEKTVLISQREHDYLPNDPLVGVVYEVTLTDYARIIATEGGGNGYKDIVVDCYPFAESYDPAEPIPGCPESNPFKAHTLLAPVTSLDGISRRAYAQRAHSVVPRSGFAVRKPGYSQPSARYLNLILTGAAEHNLPISYRDHLSRVPTYRITTVRQKIGKLIFLVSWGPFMLLMLRLSKILAGPDGRSPQWLMKLSDIMITAMWGSYEIIFRPLFGDGERTLE